MSSQDKEAIRQRDEQKTRADKAERQLGNASKLVEENSKLKNDSEF